MKANPGYIRVSSFCLAGENTTAANVANIRGKSGWQVEMLTENDHPIILTALVMMFFETSKAD